MLLGRHIGKCNKRDLTLRGPANLLPCGIKNIIVPSNTRTTTVMRQSTLKHSAAGQMAGYLFQPERALYWLAKSPRGSAVGVELADDVVVNLRQGYPTEVILEQLKSSTSSYVPFSDKGKDLWNTLHLWLELLEANVVDVGKTKFHLVSNRQIKKDSIAYLIAAKQIKDCLAVMKQVKKDPSDTIKDHVNYVLSPSRAELLNRLLNQIEVDDGSDVTDLKGRILDELNLPDTMPQDDIYNALLGWIHEVVVERIKANQEPLIDKTAFSERLYSITAKLSKQNAVEKAARLIPISKADREAQRASIFVRQLMLIAFEQEDNEILEAIDDYLRCEAERVRLTTEGKITREDFVEFDDRLKKIWSRIFNRIKRQFKEKLPISQGQDIYNETIGVDRRETLAGRPTIETYLTSGRYHFLANNLSVGWHPDYLNLLQEKRKGSVKK